MFSVARVVLDHLSKSFQGPDRETICAVNDLSLTVEDRELLVLVGPSGCGKTTTLRLIAGLEEIDSGTVSLDGTAVNKLPPKDRDVAMVFQNHALYPHMTVYENLAFGLKLRKYPKPQIEHRVKEAAQLFALNDCLDRKPSAISGGQRQRVALGRAIVRDPKVFLLDEPLSNLDAPMRLQMRAEISTLHTRLGSTMIYVTHDQVEAMTLGNRIAVMKEGLLQQVADPMTLYQHPANMFVAGFIGSPPMNFFTGRLMQAGAALAFKETNGQGEVPPNALSLRLDGSPAGGIRNFAGKKIVLGIRPEHITEERLVPGAPEDNTVKTVAEVIMPTGPEVYLHASSAAHSFVARVPAPTTLVGKQPVELVFDVRFAHFFDPESQNRIN
jgi:multiple sugar transport system ATP-binding protein